MEVEIEEIHDLPESEEKMLLDIAEHINDRIPSVMYCHKKGYTVYIDNSDTKYVDPLDELAKQAQELKMGYE